MLLTYTVGPAGSGAQYTSIQAAINVDEVDSNNDTITIAPGTYQEQLMIAKPNGTLTILGAGQGSTIVKSPASLTPDALGSRNVVGVTAGSRITLSGVTVDGSSISSGNTIDTGIFVNGNSTASISAVTVQNINANPINGVQTGVGIQVGQATTNSVATATISGVTVQAYQKDGIEVDNTGSSASIIGSTVTGAGATGVIAQNGIQISNGANATISGNNISNNQYTGTAASFGIGVYIQGVSNGASVTSNTISGNDVGIYNLVGGSGTTTTLSNNTISGDATGDGIFSYALGSSVGATNISGNTVDNNYTGIDSDSTGATTISGNALGSNIPNSYDGIEVDGGTVTASLNTISGGSIGLDAVAYDGNVSVSINGSTISNAGTGILIDSTEDSSGYTSTVTVDHPLISPATTVTSSVSGAHGASIAGTLSHLVLAVAPTVMLNPGSPIITSNSDGTYNATFAFTGHDNVTSPNDLTYQYQLDNGPVMPASSPLTLNNLSSGPHTLTLIVTDQGGLSTSTNFIFTNNPMIQDGGFETPVVGSGNFQYQPSGSPWTFSQYAGISGNGSAFTSSNPNAPEGVQVGFIQKTNSFSQSVNFPAGTYALTFQAAQRGNYQASSEDFKILIGNTVVATFKPSSTSYATFTTPAFTVSSGYSAVTFQGLDTAGGDNTALIDNISIAVANPQVPVINDGGFETPVVGSGNFQYQPTNSSWTFSQYAGISGNGSAFTSSNPNAPEGVQVGFIQKTNSFSQSVNFPVAGTFVITFQAAQRGNYQASSEDFKILIGNTVVATFKPSSTSYATFTTPAFTVSSGYSAVTFQGLDTAGGDNTALIDNISIAVTNSQVPTINDSGFETPVVGSGNFQYQPSGSPWTFSQYAGISGNGSAFTSSNPNAPEGAQVGFIQTTNSFSQTVSGFAAAKYTISFQAAQRGNYQASSEDFEILVDNIVVGTFNPTGTSYQTLTTNSFTVTAGAHTIEFLGLDSNGGDNTIFIDNISLAIANS